MNITILLLTILTSMNCLHACKRYNIHGLKKYSLRYILLNSDKKMVKMFKLVNDTSKCYYNKLVGSFAEGISKYNTLSEEDRTIIETIVSLCY